MENETIKPEDKSQNVTGIIYTALSNFKKHFKRNPDEIEMSQETRIKFSDEIEKIRHISNTVDGLLFQGKLVKIVIQDDPSLKQSFEIR